MDSLSAVALTILGVAAFGLVSSICFVLPAVFLNPNNIEDEDVYDGER